ncbi:alpha/beta hydrolase [Mycobacterium sp. SP-6446]|uniref:putative alpha/beta hydrolase n=1 Tax=Mycobacterium sp. SP-6446 TaxID=1834162 RepID=UPI00096CDC01|nr:alpha/beta hydrolase [Mycobacterium sp. SP-6446]OMC09408.1 hypothetical protein A5736_04685 [Mycobacterium sp. SP-6446]
MPPPSLRNLNPAALTSVAGGDPWQLQDQLLAGNPFQISELGSAFHRAGSHTDQADAAFDQALTHFQQGWASGNHSHPINDSREVNDTKDGLHLSSDALRKIGTDLEEIAAALTDAQNNTRAPIEELDQALIKIDSALAQLQGIVTRAYEAPSEPLYHAAIAAVSATYGQLKKIVDDYDNLLDDRMKDLESTGYIPAVKLNDGVPSIQLPSSTDPVAINQWWTSLKPAEQQEVLAAHPDQIGNLNGVPVVDRSAANEHVMNADIHLVEDAAASHHVSIGAVTNNPTEYGLIGDAKTRYDNAINVRAGLNAYSSPDNAEHSGQRPPTYLYAYQPLAFEGKGRAAIAIGNPDTAPNTAVLVPGASQSVHASDASDKGYFAVQTSQAQNLYVESNRANPGHPTAVVAWMGYDDPANGLTAVAFPDPNASAERAGGNLLAQDVNGLWATHQGPSHMTVVGYSSGAIVTSDAAAASHMHTNDMVLLGPVITDQAHNAADFHLDGGHVYVGQASNDANAHFGHEWLNGLSTMAGLGGEADPIAPDYGATRIKAETPPSYNSPFYYTPEAHLHYFDPGSESLYATTDITSGNANQLAADHMLANPEKLVPAPGRAGWEGLQTVKDPETNTGVQDDHYH